VFVVCRSCAQESAVGTKFCPNCGSILLADTQLGRRSLNSAQVLIKLNVIRYFVNSIQDQNSADTQRYS
jgi:hypothetical protein